jgi:hypothetical protein
MACSVGFWETCSGCAESNEGVYDPKLWPPHPKHGVPQGMGCSECKGKGVVFTPWTKADEEAFDQFARESLAR